MLLLPFAMAKGNTPLKTNILNLILAHVQRKNHLNQSSMIVFHVKFPVCITSIFDLIFLPNRISSPRR